MTEQKSEGSPAREPATVRIILDGTIARSKQWFTVDPVNGIPECPRSSELLIVGASENLQSIVGKKLPSRCEPPRIEGEKAFIDVLVREIAFFALDEDGKLQHLKTNMPLADGTRNEVNVVEPGTKILVENTGKGFDEKDSEGLRHLVGTVVEHSDTFVFFPDGKEPCGGYFLGPVLPVDEELAKRFAAAETLNTTFFNNPGMCTTCYRKTPCTACAAAPAINTAIEDALRAQIGGLHDFLAERFPRHTNAQGSACYCAAKEGEPCIDEAGCFRLHALISGAATEAENAAAEDAAAEDAAAAEPFTSETERLAWNLAGCLTLAESRAPLNFKREGASPALLAVAALVDDYVALRDHVECDHVEKIPDDESEVEDLIHDEPSIMTLLAFAVMKAGLLPESFIKRQLSDIDSSAATLRTALGDELQPDSAVARVLARKTHKAEAADDDGDDKRAPLTTPEVTALLHTWLKPDSKLHEAVDAAAREYDAMKAGIEQLKPEDLTGDIFTAMTDSISSRRPFGSTRTAPRRPRLD